MLDESLNFFEYRITDSDGEGLNGELFPVVHREAIYMNDLLFCARQRLLIRDLWDIRLGESYGVEYFIEPHMTTDHIDDSLDHLRKLSQCNKYLDAHHKHGLSIDDNYLPSRSLGLYTNMTSGRRSLYNVMFEASLSVWSSMLRVANDGWYCDSMRKQVAKAAETKFRAPRGGSKPRTTLLGGVQVTSKIPSDEVRQCSTVMCDNAAMEGRDDGDDEQQSIVVDNAHYCDYYSPYLTDKAEQFGFDEDMDEYYGHEKSISSPIAPSQLFENSPPL